MTTPSPLGGPRRIQLDKTYHLRRFEPDNVEEWAPKLWQLLDAEISFTADIRPLRSVELSALMRERFINHVLARLVVGGCFAIKDVASEDDRFERMTEAVDDVIDVDDLVRDRVTYFLMQICQRILRHGAELTSHQNAAVRRRAINDGHRCYLCGRFLHHDKAPFGADDEPDIKEIRKKRAFEIEHLWPQALGGSQARTNLASSCMACNKLKAHHLGYCDFPIEQFWSVADESKEDSVRSGINGPVRAALYWKQHGCCALCDQKFYEMQSEIRYITRRERSEPYHFFNIMICCEDCNASRSLNGVSIR